ncbi:MAG: hypothetical protein U9Q94_05475 [Candidatus Bipolaricaulota bacterium]|nr:hypothetical protein [Candidatus Bipolaricaulota bacterium]
MTRAMRGAVLSCLITGLLSLGTQVYGTGITPVCFDSGTRVVQEVAEALTGQGNSVLNCYPPGSGIFLGLLSLLPQDLRIAGIEWGMSVSLGEPPRKFDSFDPVELGGWCVSQYQIRAYRAIVIGSPNGGVAHLASLLHAPFLTSSFGLAIRHSLIDPDDIDAYAATGDRFAAALLNRAAPGSIEVIDHYDPLHDRSLVKYVNFLRVKLLSLPSAYREFIRKSLAPGGKIVLVDCTYPWAQFRVGKGSYFQVGGLGAVTPEEYLKEWGRDLPLEARPESEWGCPPEFAAAVKQFAEEEGIELIEIRYPHPADYGLLSYRAYLACAGVRKEEVMFDCFNYQNPLTNLQSGIPALWLPFNTEDGVSFARGFLADSRFKQIYLALLPSFARSPDTVHLKTWENLLSSHGAVKLLGIDTQAFPADTLAPFRYVTEMKQLRQEYQLSTSLELDIATLERLLRNESVPSTGACR